MRILIVNIYFHPDPTGTGWVITELARDLAAQGHSVTVITSVPHYGLPGARERNAGNRAQGTVSLWREELMDGIRVIRTAVYVPRLKTFWTRILNYGTFSALAMAAGLRSGAQDVILCTSPPLSIGLSAWILSRLKRIPFVFNVQDIYPDAAVLMGMVRNPRLIASLGALERFIYRKASLVTVISNGAKDNLRAKGVPDAKLRVIPNWVDTQEIQPGDPQNEFRRSVLNASPPTPYTPDPAPHTHLVMFAGNIGLIAGLETVLDAAASLKHRPDIHFLLVGEGNAKAELKARAARMGLRNVTFLPTQPREILPQVLAAADVHLVTLKRQMSSTSVPSKSYSIMASGRPMVAAVDPGSEIWHLVEAADVGLCVLPEEPAALAQAIEELCDSPDRRQAMGENARAYVIRCHAKAELTALYGETLEAVAKKTGARSEAGPRAADDGVSDGRSAPGAREGGGSEERAQGARSGVAGPRGVPDLTPDP
jgi:colanic acid biosynthesis glycosyl transferase WcaI